jgi:hypothetical protein
MNGNDILSQWLQDHMLVAKPQPELTMSHDPVSALRELFDRGLGSPIELDENATSNEMLAAILRKQKD